jgi:large-conductance mechanosensitive channel
MDDTPKAFLEELRLSVLKKRVGQIALAVVLAQAVWRFIGSLVWYVIIPVIDKLVNTATDSVMFQRATRPFPWENLLGSLAEFLLSVVVVFYLNRWIHGIRHRSVPLASQKPEPEYSSVGKLISPHEPE